jgi:phosphatidylglycerophosphatase A
MNKEKKSLSVYLSTLFGLGLFSKMPGTIGSFFAFLVYIILPHKWFVETGMWHFFIILIVLTLLSIPVLTKAEKKLGRDHGSMVLDEFFGYFFAVLFLPKTILLGFGAFILFRIFDIFKPYPIYKLQKLPKGWGVMLDDILAGIYTNICLQFIYLIIK